MNSLLQRARKRIEARREDAAPPEVPSSDADLFRRFISTWESGDGDAFAALLADDAIFSMPPQPEWFAGREAIRQFFTAAWSRMPGKRRLLPLGANGGPAVAVYTRPMTPGAPYVGSAITLLTIRRSHIARITRFGSPRLFPLFGLPTQLPHDV